MNTTFLKVTAGFFSAILAFNALADDPTISDVVARQRWPWSRLVDIDYVLTCDSSQSVDITITGEDVWTHCAPDRFA
jgi:hypothetical protein